MSNARQNPKKGKQTRRKPRPLSRPMNQATLGIPDSRRTSLTYADIITLAPATAITQYTFRGNSIYDPDQTSTGHQPLYHDQMAQLYSRYRVYGSSIQLAIVNQQVASALQMTVIPASDIITFTGSTYPPEYPYAKKARLIGVGGIFTSEVVHRMTTSEILGLRSREILDQDYSALMNANPSSEWYWQVVLQNLSSAQDVDCSLQVTIRYDVEFYDRVTITPSYAKSQQVAQPAKSLVPNSVTARQT